jgi:hypothetical protein
MKSFIVLIALLFSTPAFAGLYVGGQTDVNHGTIQAVVGASSLIGPFGVEATHNTHYILPSKYTVCGNSFRSISQTCTSAEGEGITNTLAATATIPLSEKLSFTGKAGVGDKSDTFLLGVGASYQAFKHFSLRADYTRYQINGAYTEVPSVGASLEF